MTPNRFGDETCSGKGEMEVPDVVGALRGIRSFDIDLTSGHLTGTFWKTRWYDGPMEAQCLQTVTARVVSEFQYQHPVLTGLPQPTRTHGYDYVDGHAVRRPGHYPAPCPGIARGDHGCGFYAHHGDKQPRRSYVSGVVEMWGQVELGPEGLRSSHARLVAVLPPTKWGRYPREVVEHGAAADTLQRRIVSRLDDEPLGEFVDYYLPSGWDRLTERREAWRRAVAYDMELLAKEAGKEGRAKQALDLFESTTQWLYPSVKVFGSMVEMLQEFPVPSLDHLFKQEAS